MKHYRTADDVQVPLCGHRHVYDGGAVRCRRAKGHRGRHQTTKLGILYRW